MKRYLETRLPALGLIVAAMLSICDANAAAPFSRLFVFGDSLSDAGNVFVRTHAAVTAPYEPIPSLPYAIGGHHFSNGVTWIEQLAAALDLAPSAMPALRSPGTFGNYAFGGARARLDGFVPGLGSQIDLFEADFQAGAPIDALYVIFIGSNDVRDALAVFSLDPSGAASNMIINEALVTIGASLKRLWLAGARHFLVAGVPDIGVTPAVRSVGPGAQFLGQFLSMTFNAYLEANVLTPAQALPGIDLVRFDVYAALNEVVDHPGSAGLSNVVAPCLEFLVLADAVCEHGDDYLFWDAVHPTRAGHRVLASAAARTLMGPRDEERVGGRAQLPIDAGSASMGTSSAAGSPSR